MNKAFEKILERLDEEIDLNPIYDYEKGHARAIRDTISIVQEVAEEYSQNIDLKHHLSKVYAQNMVDYGIDVTRKLQTATQQSYALEQAYIRGRQSKRDRFTELRKEYKAGWIPCNVRLPDENIEVDVTIKEIDGSTYTKTSWLQEGQWVVKKSPLEPKVIAWKERPEPYYPEGE